MEAKVIPINAEPQESAAAQQSLEVHDVVPAFVGAAVHQTNAENFELEQRFHKRAVAYVERINQLTPRMVGKAEEAAARWAEWTETERQATHLPFVGKLLLVSLLIITIFGEWILAATALKGMRLDDAETYIMALGVVGVGFCATKGMAWLLRWLIAEHWSKPLFRTMDLIMLVVGVVFLSVLIWGMTEARVAYSEADKGTGGAGLSAATTHGLNLLQAAFYALQVFVFWALASPDPKGERARKNYVAARSALTKLHGQRTKLASILNLEANDVRAKAAASIERACQFVSHYYRELSIHGKTLPSNVSSELRHDWFLSPSDRISGAVDEMPEVVHSVLSANPASQRWHWPKATARDGSTPPSVAPTSNPVPASEAKVNANANGTADASTPSAEANPSIKTNVSPFNNKGVQL